MIEIWAGPLARERERADPAGRSAGVSGRSLRKAIKKHALRRAFLSLYGFI